MATISRARPGQYREIAVLFDLYRQFYEQDPDAAGCEAYIRDRLIKEQSVIFTAIDDESGSLIGFTQLYISWCSVAMNRLVHLYDLYVTEQARQRGVGRQLMEAAREYATELGADRICLETAVDNLSAQSLYESLGYIRDADFHTYNLPTA
jgi:ribosomal protein S18 acetylase RimI-like enzyme